MSNPPWSDDWEQAQRQIAKLERQTAKLEAERDALTAELIGANAQFGSVHAERDRLAKSDSVWRSAAAELERQNQDLRDLAGELLAHFQEELGIDPPKDLANRAAALGVQT